MTKYIQKKKRLQILEQLLLLRKQDGCGFFTLVVTNNNGALSSWYALSEFGHRRHKLRRRRSNLHYFSFLAQTSYMAPTKLLLGYLITSWMAPIITRMRVSQKPQKSSSFGTASRMENASFASHKEQIPHPITFPHISSLNSFPLNFAIAFWTDHIP